MKKIVYIFVICFLGTVTYIFADDPAPDSSFIQPVSVKYTLAKNLEGSTLKKVVSDYNGNIYVLTDQGLGRIQGKKVVKDLLYRPLADKVPVDVTIQENTGYLYYLYKNAFLSNTDAGKPYGTLPEDKYDKIAVAADGRVFLSGDSEFSLFKDGKITKIYGSVNNVISIRVNDGTFYVLCPDAVYRIADHKLVDLHHGENMKTFTFQGNNILLGTTKGYYGIDKSTGKITISLQTHLPTQNINVLVNVDHKIWAGTIGGAFVRQQSGRFHYFASKRWLNENRVISMTSDNKKNIYLLTPTGLNEIKFIHQTYRKKAKYFEAKIRKRHIRYGLLAEVRMKKPGDLSTAEMIDTDNDGLWTSFYLGSQVFRYAVTKSPRARQYAWESFKAYERLVSISSVKGLPARSMERTGYKVSDRKKWRSSPDSGWEWKGTTSSDEFVGYIFVAALMDQFVAKTKAEKQRVADYIDNILAHIIKHHYNFVDADGEPTLWGRWNPKYINWYAKTISDRKLGSTDIIAGLQLGYALTGKEIYKKEALRLLNKHGYLQNIMISPYNIKPTPGYIYKGHDMGEGGWNHSDDEMEFLSYWVLYHYALNKDLQQKYAKAIQEYWKIERPEKNPVWNLISLGTDGAFDKSATLWYLREFPMDLIRWDVKNSKRKDLTFLKPNFRHQYTKKILSPAARPAHRYNANEFRLDGGEEGRTELTGAEYLLPYWMARYLHVIKN